MASSIPTISLSDKTLNANDTAIVTITFVDNAPYLELADLTARDGTFSDLHSGDSEGFTWTATFKPNSGVSASDSVITLDNSAFGGTGTTSSEVFTVDTVAPSVTIAMDDTELKMNETATVTINFSEAVTGMSDSKVTASSGTLSAFTTSNGGLTWTSVFTPTPETSSFPNWIGFDTTGVTDLAGNAAVVGPNGGYYSVNTMPGGPTATIEIDDTTLNIDDTAAVTITFTEAVEGFDSNDLTVGGGAVTGLTSSDEGTTWHGTLAPAAGAEKSGNVISLDQTGVTGRDSGLAGTGNATSAEYKVDAKAPTATIVVADDALKAGESSLVTIIFSERVKGLDLADLTVANGTLSAPVSDDEGVTWTATFTPKADVSDTTNLITLDNTGVTDMAANAGAGTTDSGNYRVDTLAPTATVEVLDTLVNANETSQVRITFSEAVIGLASDDFQVEGGTLSNPVSDDEGTGVHWSATFTPSEDVEGSGKHITLNYAGIADTAGNAGVGSIDSNAYTVDTVAPSATLSMDDVNLATGETTTVRVSFSEKVTGMDDDKVHAPNGMLSPFTTADGGKTWTSTFTPNAGVSYQDNMLSLNVSGIADLAGNAAGVANPASYSIDTMSTQPGPTATIEIDDTALNRHETAGVTITFSEAVTGFDDRDVAVGSGTLEGLGSDDGGKTWYGTLRPEKGVETTGNAVSVDLSGITGSISGVAGVGNAVSNTYSVDSKGLTANIVMADAALTAGETSLVTITFSERVASFNPFYVSAPNGTIGALSTSDEGITWTTTFTPKANVIDTANQVSVLLEAFIDMAGNIGSGVATSNNYAVDTMPPAVVTPTPTPTPTPPVTVDGVPIKKTTGTAADGSKTQVITVPTVTMGRVDKDGGAALADIPLVKASDGSALLSVGVPVGYGLKASGSVTAKGAGDSLANLIAEIKAHTVSGSQSQQSMTGGGSGFLGSLDADTPLLVQTIVVSTDKSADAAGGSLVIRGALSGDNAPHTALVIDASALPAGSAIELQDVSFAAVIGNVSLRGGDGAQVVYGDSGSQNIMLGADDDVLHGGAGNDIIGSAGGNDQIFGDEGDDIVFGGEGNDIIDGGIGNDIVQLVGAGRADYSFRIDDGKLVMTHLNGGVDGTDIVSNVETLRFTGAAADVDVAFRDTDVASLVRLYDAAFGRNPDEAGLNYWISLSEEGASLRDIAVAMAASEEAQQHAGLSNEAYVQWLYSEALGRTGAAFEVQWWTDLLDSGVMVRGEALLEFADSAEMIGLVGVVDTSIDVI